MCGIHVLTSNRKKQDFEKTYWFQQSIFDNTQVSMQFEQCFFLNDY